MKIYELMISLIEKGKVADHTVLNYLMLKSIKGDNKVVNKKTGATIEQHQYQISRRKLAEKTCLSEQQIKTVISHLVKIGAISYAVVEGQYLFTVNYIIVENNINPANPLCSNEFKSLATQQSENSTQQSKKINPAINPVNSLNNRELQDFATQQSTQQNEKNNPTYINNNLINKDLLKMDGVSTGISTGEKIENCSAEQIYYSDSQFEYVEITTSTPTPIFEYKEEKKKDDLSIQRESFKQKARKLHTIQLIQLIDSTYSINVDEKTTKKRNEKFAKAEKNIKLFEETIDSLDNFDSLTIIYSNFECVISNLCKEIADEILEKETIENTKKEYNCSDSTANKVYLLFKEVNKLGGSTDCPRFKRQKNRIIQQGDAFDVKWISKNASEIVADPNLQTKF